MVTQSAFLYSPSIREERVNNGLGTQRGTVDCPAMPFARSLRAVLFLALFALPIFAGDNRWTIKGPDGGNIHKFAFDPANTTIVFAATDNGIFRSVDGGQHWTLGGALGTSIMDVAVAPSDTRVVYAGSVYGLYKSTTRGVTWSVVHPFASYGVAVSATNANIVYSDSSGGPWRSTDGGVTFDSVGSGLAPSPSAAQVLAVDPQNPAIVYAGFHTTVGVYKSTDGGAHWTAANSGLPQVLIFSLLIDPTNTSTLYASAAPGLFKSTDGGGSWTALSNGLPPSPYGYSLSMGAGSPLTLLAGLAQGAYKSVDGGTTWTVLPGFNVPALATGVDPSNPANLLISTNVTIRSSNGGTSFAATSGLTASLTQAIAVDPQNESIVYAGGPSGIFKSSDRGESWTLLPGTGGTTSLAVDAQSSQTIYAITSAVLRRSTDGGASWSNFTTGLPAGTPAFLVADPHEGGTIYTLLGNAAYKRSGSGAWTSSSTGAGPMTFLTIDANNPSILYGGGAGMFKSTNGGANWTPASGGLSGIAPIGLTIDPFDSNHVLSWSNSSAFESTDGGANWTPFSVAPGRQAILLAFDPTGPGRIYNSSYDAMDRSVDGGKTWVPMQLGFGRSHGDLFVIAPGGNILYTGGSSGGVWVIHFARGRAVSH